MITPDGKVYVDTTLLKSLSNCKLQCTLKHGMPKLRKPEESPALHAGIAVHECLDRYQTSLFTHTKDVAINMALLRFDERYKQWSEENVLPDNRLNYKNVYDIIKEWLEARSDNLPWIVNDPRQVEVGFSYPLNDTNRYYFYGRMDIIGQYSIDNSWVVVDHKTTGDMDMFWSDQFKTDPQDTGYIWAAQKHNKNVNSMLINGIELSKLPESDRPCKKHGLKYSECRLAHVKSQIVGPISRTEWQIERWKWQALNMAKEYEYYYNEYGVDLDKIAFYAPAEGLFNGSCRFCSFREWCQTGMHIAMLQNLGFQEDEWTPYNPLELPTSPLWSIQ